MPVNRFLAISLLARTHWRPQSHLLPSVRPVPHPTDPGPDHCGARRPQFTDGGEGALRQLLVLRDLAPAIGLHETYPKQGKICGVLRGPVPDRLLFAPPRQPPHGEIRRHYLCQTMQETEVHHFPVDGVIRCEVAFCLRDVVAQRSPCLIGPLRSRNCQWRGGACDGLRVRQSPGVVMDDTSIAQPVDY